MLLLLDFLRKGRASQSDAPQGKRTYPAALNDAFGLLFRSSLGLMFIFACGRLFYLWDYRSMLQQDQYRSSELLMALLSATRFDISASVYAMLPAILGTLCGAAFLSTARLLRFLKNYTLTLYVISWLFIVSDHYFYVYFRDHFNAFFWEFWEDLSNAGLVVGGLNESIPLGQTILALIIGLALIVGLERKLIRSYEGLNPRLAHTLGRLKWLTLPLWLALVFIGSRGTFDGRPLLIQDRRIAFSSSTFINLLHTNPIFPMLRSLEDRREARLARQRMQVNDTSIQDDLQKSLLFVPGAQPRAAANGKYWYMAQDLDPVMSRYLKKRPKHVVLFLMESYSSWVMDYKEEGFDQAMAPNMMALRKNSLSFAHHFPPSGGTVKNLGTLLLSFPQPREFQPSINYHREGHKPFPDRLPGVMKRLGYKPRFYYAGNIAWHRLYQFMPMMGFEDVYGENNFNDLPHSQYGLYDRDLFFAVHRHLQQADQPTFSFILSQSNHPPYYVPDEFNDHTVKLPELIRSRLVDPLDHFYKRINAFRFADASLGDFFARAKNEPYFDDTLFVITGDHPFGGGVTLPSEWGWKDEKIPFLLYGPGVLKDEWAGKEIKTFTTHVDIMPTLAQLLTEKPLSVHTWGKPAFSPQAAATTGINMVFTCIDGTCLKKNVLYRVTDDEWLEPIKNPKEEEKERIRALEHSYYNGALQYLYRFEP